MDAELKALIIERGQIKAALTRFKRFCSDSAQSVPIRALQKRLEANTGLYESFTRVQNQIERMVAGTELEAAQATERDQFEDAYFLLIGEVETYIESKQSPPQGAVAGSPATVPAGSPAPSITQLKANLPVIKIPSFDGNYSDWVKFRDTFLSLIHRNDLLDDIQKFHYLQSALTGPAARVIHSLGVSESNYQFAWTTLTARYENSAALKRHHVLSFLDLPAIQKASPAALRELLDDANNHLIALRSLGISVESWDPLIVPILSRKLDSASVREWGRKNAPSSTEMSTFRQFTAFLEERAHYLEDCAWTGPSRIEQPANLGSRRPPRVTAHIANTIDCPVCEAAHPLSQCKQFKTASVDERTDMIKQYQACFNCLQPGHTVKKCTRSHCRICNRKHHSLLHRDGFHPSGKTESTQATPTTTCVAHVANDPAKHTLLATAVVYVDDHKKKKRECRVLLDSGSQTHLIADNFCRKLGLKVIQDRKPIGGVGQTSNMTNGRVEIQLSSRTTGFRARISCLTINRITQDMPNIPVNRADIQIPPNITLADPAFNQPGKIDLLLGAELFWQLLCVGQHTVNHSLVLQKTQLGWVLGGSLFVRNEQSPSNGCYLTTNRELHDQIEKFWKLEECSSNTDLAPEECEQHFVNTVERNTAGRFIVSIPFNEKLAELGSSRSQAELRFRAIERKLAKDSELRREYIRFMGEYEQLGHMSEINISEDSSLSSPSYYLPHHAVSKQSSTTTKIRVVFDGSAKTTTGISLNDAQMVGPTVQSDLVAILLRFRLHRYVLTADIAKMYRQILVQPRDRTFQRILWRSDPTTPIRVYQLNTVTYGTASASFLATRVLRQLGIEVRETYPRTSQVIEGDFYVDDLLTGTETIDGAKRIRQELSQVLLSAGFELRKWASNCSRILETEIQDSKELGADKDPKTLGLQWSPTEDVLTFDIQPIDSRRITKRIILSDIARIFDPLGLIGPVITQAKLIMQTLWQMKLGWDESVSQELYTRWLEYRKELSQLASIRIPRRIIDHLKDIAIHGFADASERAYGACIYLRSPAGPGGWSVRLLCSKSRVAPLKSVSLPRLELCAALLLARLVYKVKTSLKIETKHEYLWSDSTIALAWIRGSPNRWKTFVANRVSEIHTLCNRSCTWRHVPSGENPADLLSRGTYPGVLKDSDLWWSGPSWLIKEPNTWPSTTLTQIDVPEEKALKSVIMTTVSIDNSIFERFSNYTRLVRVTAHCLKFISRCATKKSNSSTVDSHILTVAELKEAQSRLIHLAQRMAYPDELISLEKGARVAKDSSLASLNPFLDKRGIIRVGGRLEQAPIDFERKHQAILPPKHPLTDLIIRHEHDRLLHAGCTQVLSSLREQLWIIQARRNVRRLVRGCVRCFRAKPKVIDYSMGQLPAPRVTPSRPFTTCGVDYAGPFLTKERTRSKITVKAYICIFVCCSSKAVHIELATDLSTEAFLNCFRRFVARRGLCRCIISDNATNFVGAKNELKELNALVGSREHHERVATFLSNNKIEWKFIPPRAPHFGGLWEGAVKSAKYHLRRVTGEQRLTFEELYTLLTQIEACLNSRPLTPMSTDPTDLNSLTPGHFLIGDALTSPPNKDLTHLTSNRLTRYQLVLQMFQHFWKRWQQEYLHQLQQSYKWTKNCPTPIEEGALVIIKEDNLPPLQWRLGRVIQRHPGKDGVTRVVTVKTVDGTYKRATNRLCLLPTTDNSCENV